MKKLAALIIVPAFALSGCATQVAAVEKALTPYEQAIQNACAAVLPIAQGLAGDMVATLVPAVATVRAGVIGGCGTIDGIISMANSLSTVQWLTTAKTVLETKGAVLPAPVAPVPVK
jgi:precorrin-6B methylase 2